MAINFAQLLLKQDISLPKGPLGLKGSPYNDSVKKWGGKSDFLKILEGVIRPTPKKNMMIGVGNPNAGTRGIHRETHANVEILKGGLSAKGVPFDHIYLKKDDLYVVKDLLDQCGYSKKSIDHLINTLLRENSGVKIKFSKIFSQLEKEGPPGEKKPQPVILNSALIPYMESVLRDFGFGPKAVDQTLNTARTSDGGLNLKKFIQRLKTVSRQSKLNLREISVTNYFEAAGQSSGESEFRLSDKKNSGQMAVSDFISALERFTDRLAAKAGTIAGRQPSGLDLAVFNKLNPAVVNKNNASSKDKGATTPAEGAMAASASGQKLLTDVKESVDRILQKVMIVDDKQQSLLSALTDSKLKHIDPAFKNILNKEGRTLTKEPPDAAGDRDEKIPLPNDAKQSGKVVSAQEDLKVVADRTAGKKGLQENIATRNFKEMPETASFELPAQSTYQSRGETASLVRATPPTQSPLPNYLVGQISRQISQSIISGEGVIKLQLKPPDLGMLRIEMDIHDHVLKLGVITENSSVRDILLANIHELRSSLSDRGIKLDKLDVQTSQNFEQSLSDSGKSLRDDQRSGQGDGQTNRFADEVVPGKEFTDNRVMLGGDYLLDLMA